jgi:hypothetical protein
MAVGAGNSNIMVQAALHDAGIIDGATPAGYCSYVGISGAGQSRLARADAAAARAARLPQPLPHSMRSESARAA